MRAGLRADARLRQARISIGQSSRHDDGVIWLKLDVLLGILALDNILVVEGNAGLAVLRVPAKDVNALLLGEIPESAGSAQ